MLSEVKSVERLVFLPVGHHASNFLLVSHVGERMLSLVGLAVPPRLVAVQMPMSHRMVLKSTVTECANLQYKGGYEILTTLTRLDIAFLVLSLYLLGTTLPGRFLSTILNARQMDGLKRPSCVCWQVVRGMSIRF
jgi:hypothetical protein